VLDALGLPFDVLVHALALLPEARQRAAAAGGDAALVAVVVLADDDALGADDQGALDQLHVALEDLHLLHVIDRDPVGFDIDRLVGVGLFRPCRAGAWRRMPAIAASREWCSWCPGPVAMEGAGNPAVQYGDAGSVVDLESGAAHHAGAAGEDHRVVGAAFFLFGKDFQRPGLEGGRRHSALAPWRTTLTSSTRSTS
jgi:hypothetical protein